MYTIAAQLMSHLVGIQTYQSILVHIYYFLSNYFCLDYFIQGIPDLPAEPEEHGEQPQQQQEEGGEEAPASGGLFTNIVTSGSSINNQHMKNIFGFIKF